MMHARRASAFGATRENAATSWESEHWPGRSDRSRGRAGGPWTSAKSALLAAFSLAAIALLCTQVDVFANGRRSGRVKRRRAAARDCRGDEGGGDEGESALAVDVRRGRGGGARFIDR